MSEILYFIPELEFESFRSKVSLKNKISDLKLDVRNLLVNYNLCFSSTHMSFHFLILLQYTLFFRTEFLVQL